MDSNDESGTVPHHAVDPAYPATTGPVHLAIADARDALLQSRRDFRREHIRVVGCSAVAAVAFGIELWGTIRGEPFFGWLVSMLFAGFAVYFWSRRRRAEEGTASWEAALSSAESELACLVQDSHPGDT